MTATQEPTAGQYELSHLRSLEAEAIHIIREVAAVLQLLRVPARRSAFCSQREQQLPGSVSECSRNVKIRCDHSTLRYNPTLYTRSRSPWRPRHQAVR
jgi:hypothetical protein